MAKSKNGGTRAMIRGRVGADVYSIGKNGKGEKQQVVRSLAETVANPQTTAQMRGRMIMSTVMQTVSGLAHLIDHSFDNVSNGQPSISEFISRNYALVKADVQEHSAAGNRFMLNDYQVKGALPGAYVIASGKAVVPASIKFDKTAIEFTLTNASGAGIKSALGLGADDYLTIVTITEKYGVDFLRVRIASNLADETAITAENISSAFSFEGNVQALVTFVEGVVTIWCNQLAFDEPNSTGLIISVKVDGGYEHNDAVMIVNEIANAKTADKVLPTYPVGSTRFLNGGEL